MVDSSWDGNYTCPDTNLATLLEIEIVRTGTTDIQAVVKVENQTIAMDGTFYYSTKAIWLASPGIRFTGFLDDSGLEMHGSVIFSNGMGRLTCPAFFGRLSGKILGLK